MNLHVLCLLSVSFIGLAHCCSRTVSDIITSVTPHIERRPSNATGKATTAATITEEVPWNIYHKIVVVIGGRNYSKVLDSVEVIDVESGNNCDNLPPYPLVHVGAVAEFYMGKIVVCGGLIGQFRDSVSTNLCYQYNEEDKNWTEFEPLGQAKLILASSIVDGVFLITGGTARFDRRQALHDFQGEILGPHEATRTVNEEVLDTTEYFDESENRFKFGPNMPVPMRKHCQVTINDTHVFLSDVFETQYTYLLNWNSRQFQPMPVIPNLRFNPTCGLCQSEERGLEVVVVGQKVPYDDYGTSDIFSLNSLTWREGPELHVPQDAIVGMQTTQIGNSFVITGGALQQSFMNTIVRYDPDQEEFIILNVALKAGRAYHTVVFVPDAQDMVNCSNNY